MAIPTITDRNVQYPNRVKLTEVSAGVYDVEAVPGNVVAAGTAVNKTLLDQYAVETQTTASSEKTVPVDADMLPLVSQASGVLTKLTWANVKATLKAYFDTLYPTGGVGAWTAWTPTITAGTGTFTSASGAGRYKQVGKIVFFSVAVTITTQGTGNYAQFSLPVTAQASSILAIGSGRSAATGKALTCFRGGTTTAELDTYDNTNAATDGAVLTASGFYEAA